MPPACLFVCFPSSNKTVHICSEFWLKCLGYLALSLDGVCGEKNHHLQELEVSRWSSWFENDGNKISSAFLPVNHQQEGGRGRRGGCGQSCCAWLLWVVSLPREGGSGSQQAQNLDVF